MSANYNHILYNLEIEDPNEEDIRVDLAPYAPEVTNKEKTKATYLALKYAIRLGVSHLILMNAYYLGELFETNPNEATSLRKLLPLHYYESSIRTYHIFRTIGRSQIYRTQNITLTNMRKLTKPLFRGLVQESIRIHLERQDNIS